MAKAKAKDQVPAVTSDNVPATLALSREELESRYLPVMHVATNPYTEFDDDTEEEERAARPDRMLIPIIGIDHGTDKFEWPDDTKSAGFTARPIFTTQTRAWWDPQGPDDKRVPDCSSANCVEPVSGCAAHGVVSAKKPGMIPPANTRKHAKKSGTFTSSCQATPCRCTFASQCQAAKRGRTTSRSATSRCQRSTGIALVSSP